VSGHRQLLRRVPVRGLAARMRRPPGVHPRHLLRRVPVRGLAAGAAASVALGAYSVVHEPSGRDFVLYGFDSSAGWKHALTLAVAVLLVAQAAIGFKLAGLFGLRPPGRPWLPELRRLIATAAVGLSLPVAFHCVWALGFGSDSPVGALHSILGCIAYGCVVAALWPNDRKPAPLDTADRNWAGAVSAVQYVVGVAAATAAVMLFTLQGAAPLAEAGETLPATPSDAQQLYAEHCADCHGKDGSGGVGSRLAGVVVPRYPDPADQSAVVAEGRNTMPAFAKVLTPDEIAAVTRYTRTAW